MKRKLALLSMVLVLLETILLFVPFCLKRVHANYSLRIKEEVNIFDVDTALERVFAILIVVLLLSVFISFLIYLFNKKTKLPALYFYSSIASLIVLLIFVYLVDHHANITFVQGLDFIFWVLNWMIYIIIIINVVLVLLSAFIRFKKTDNIPFGQSKECITNNNTDEIKESYSSNGTSDEIMKFKELLDKGVITQEEFDAKKKQLLGL